MKETRILMGMPATIDIVDSRATAEDLEKVFAYLQYVDETFSTYKETSEISRINAGQLSSGQWSQDMRYVMEQCERTMEETHGYFNIDRDGHLDPSGYVKGWAIQNAAGMLAAAGYANYYVEIAGDLQVGGTAFSGKPWVIGIRNPFNRDEIVKRVSLLDKGMATSGTAVRGQHIYNPHRPSEPITEIVSLTVIGPAIVDADRFATAAFAMGKEGIEYVSSLDGFEGYMIDAHGLATFTDGFSDYALSQ